MSIKQRVEKLEAKHLPPAAYYYSHTYTITRGQESGDTRKDCPKCAAMSDEEYAAYSEWCKKQKARTHVVICRPAEAEEPSL